MRKQKSKLHVTVTNDGKTVYDADGEMVMLGVLQGRDCDTLTEGNGNNAMMATLVTSLLQHIEETTDENPELTPLVIVLNKIMRTEHLEDGTV